MKAVFFERHGGPEVLRYGDFPDPTPGPGEVRVRVRACSLNYLDIFSRRGMPGIRIELPSITGGDCAGEVDAIGPGVTDWKPGQRVLVDPAFVDRAAGRIRMLGENCRGAFAELCVVHHSQLIALPDDVRDEDAACLPVAYGTSHRMLFTRGELRAGEKILILGASGGVGVSCLQFAKMVGAEVFAVTSSEEKAAKLKAIGADHTIVSTGDFSKAVWAATGKKGVDVAINFTGGDTWIPTQRSMAVNGRILTCGSTAGHMCTIDVRFVWVREIEIVGSRAYRPDDIKSCLQFVSDGSLKPVVEKELPLDQAAEGVRMLDERRVFGKIIVHVNG